MSLLHRRPRPDERAAHVISLDGPVEARGWLRRPVLARQADRALDVHLDRELHDIGVALHDVALPNSTCRVGHVAVAPSGVWIIDVRHVGGRIERRDIGTWRAPETRLHIDGTDCTDLIDVTAELKGARDCLAALVPNGVPIHRAVCLIDAQWPMTARPFEIDGVWVTWPKALTDKIQSSGLIQISKVHEIAAVIRSAELADA